MQRAAHEPFAGTQLQRPACRLPALQHRRRQPQPAGHCLANHTMLNHCTSPRAASAARRRVHVGASAGAGDPAGAGDAASVSGRQAIQEGVERAAKLIDDMLEEIMRSLFVEQAAAYISEEQAALSEEEAVRNAVIQRIEFLDANFLAALSGYIEVLRKAGSEGRDLLPLMELVRTEVLYQVSLRLPPAARVLNRALQEVDKEQRVDVLRTALSGGQGDMPGCDSDALSTASTQFIDDMEDQEQVADRALLARLCLVREEVRWVSAELAFATPDEEPSSTGGANGEARRLTATQFARSNVPQRPATFINQLVSVKEPAMRVGLISRAFCEDWEGAAPRQKPQSPAHKGQPDFVRPGRFMATLHAMMQNIESEEDSGASPANIPPGLLRRLADIQMEAITVLDKMQRGELKPVV